MDPIVIDPVTRVSGDCQVEVFFSEDGTLQDAHFRASGFRGFERLVQGAHLDNVLPLVSRICGACSVFHQVAAARALEGIAGVQVSGTAQKLRELLLLGKLFQNHALSLTLHSLPDLLFPMSDRAVRNIFSIYRVEEEIVRKVFVLRSIGSQVVEAVGGSSVHPLNVIPGGVLRPLGEEKRSMLLGVVREAEPLLDEMSRLIKMLCKRNQEVIQNLGNGEHVHLSLRKEEGLALQEGRVRVVNEKGEQVEEFPGEEFFKLVSEVPLPHSQVKAALLRGERRFRVGPLARLNTLGRFGTPRADAEVKDLRDLWEDPLQKSLLAHAARMIEVIHAWEKMVELLGDQALSAPDLHGSIEPEPGRGVGLVETPEGILAYYLEVNERGCLDRLNIISPLQCNNFPLQDDLRQSAQQMARVLESQENMRNRLEMVVRSYAPCIPCGVH